MFTKEDLQEFLENLLGMIRWLIVAGITGQWLPGGTPMDHLAAAGGRRGHHWIVPPVSCI